jgi:cysteinyl-tRNA synthetase
MPKAIQILWKLIKEDLEGKYETIKKMDEVFGLNLLEKEKIEIPKKIKIILEKRKLARKNKDWKKSDELRDKIKEEGFQVKDTSEGQVLEKL